MSEPRGVLLAALLGALWTIGAKPVPVSATETNMEPASTPEISEPERQTTDDESGDTDDTPDVDTDNSIDEISEEDAWKLSGDLRALYDNLELEDRDGEILEEDSFAARLRLGFNWGATEYLQFGVRLAGRCLSEECDPELVLESAIPGPNGLKSGQLTFDQLYLHWLKRERFDIALGRLQTRFVLRGGVFARSLDRNDSNNVNVTWTDGLHASYRARQWASHFVLQRNSAEGSGSIRRGPLDFSSSSARNTFFLAFENTTAWGPVAQRALDVSYLPSSLLTTGDPNGPREDYWGLVGRLALRWPQRTDGPRLRAGVEAGYAPETQAPGVARLGAESGDIDGFAWNVVLSLMEFAAGHSIGVNYARTPAGWLLSPQFRPNEEQFELRYQWRTRRAPVIETRFRWREDLESLAGAERDRETFDFFVRLTWRFTLRD